MSGDCRSCKSWKECPTPERDWYSYGEIRWCPYQVFFLLKWAEYLRIGIWPTPESTCETPKRTLSKEAQYVNAAIVIAELDYRLGKTGIKGELLASQCKEPDRDKMDYLSDSAKDALYYVSGWARKATNFATWLAVNRYRKYNKVGA
ncbi:hypothetical protein MUP46_03670 [Patescibacteria group bacterium]|nr:hypothetical protein [Patescibacteria group bacterium]